MPGETDMSRAAAGQGFNFSEEVGGVCGTQQGAAGQRPHREFALSTKSEESCWRDVS